MVMPSPLALSTMAASMSEKAINEQKDYREEKLDALDKLTFEELRGVEVPIPTDLNSFEKFNMSVRITLMKRHGLYEGMLDEFKKAIRDNVINNTQPVARKGEDEAEEEMEGFAAGGDERDDWDSVDESVAEEAELLEETIDETADAGEEEEVEEPQDRRAARPRKDRSRYRRGRHSRSGNAESREKDVRSQGDHDNRRPARGDNNEREGAGEEFSHATEPATAD